MRASELDVYEVPNRQQLPPNLTVGAIYFLMDEAKLIVNHGGGRIVEYGGAQEGGSLPEVGYWAIANGGTGATTQAGARANLQALGLQDTAAKAKQLETGRRISVSGAVSGSAVFLGDRDITIVTTAPPDPDLSIFEAKANKVVEVRSATQATHTNYPSESAVRTELDKYALKSEVVQNYKGVFPTGAALKAAIPQAKPGDYALVTETNTTWAWNNNPGAGPLGWYDTEKIESEGIKSVNGKMGEAITLDITEDLGGMTSEAITSLTTTIYNAKEDKLLDTTRAALAAATTASGTNRFATIQDATLDPSISGLPAVVATHTDDIATLKAGQGTARIIETSMLLSREIDAQTMVPVSTLPPQTLPYGVGRTLIRDPAGNLGVIAGVDAENLTVVTITNSSIDAHAVWLGFVENIGDLPKNDAESVAVFGRAGSLTDYARVRVDETQQGATVEYRITDKAEDGTYTWGNPFILNTTQYQEQTTAVHAGKIPIAGSVPGTWDGWVDPSHIYQRWQMDLYFAKGVFADPPEAHILGSRMLDAGAWIGRTGEKLVIIGALAWWLAMDYDPAVVVPRIRLRYGRNTPSGFEWTVHTEDMGISLQRGVLHNTLFTSPIHLENQAVFDVDLLTPGNTDNLRLHVYGYVVYAP
jgi:hypothetical protein